MEKKKPESQWARLKRERDERIIGYIKANMTAKEIGHREGWDVTTARKERAKVGVKYLKMGPKEQFTETASSGGPYGLTDSTHQLRYALGTALYNLDDRKGMHRLEIAHHVGLAPNQQKIATGQVFRNKYLHDWKLSQIERLAALWKMDPNRLIILSMAEELKKQAGKRKIGDMIEEWLNGTV